MISDEELKKRQAFEAALVAAGSLMSTAWDDDYDEYVYDDAEQMYRGWTLAQDTRLDSELAKVAEPVVLSQESRKFLIDMMDDDPHHGWGEWRKAKEELESIQPVVLDLGELKAWSDGDPEEGLVIKQNDLLAAIRAQLPNLEVRV
jgi:hypothetical protein